MKKCLDCFHFKTKEFRTLNDIKMLGSPAKLITELKKAKKEMRPAKYWRCSLGRQKQEFYILL